MAPSCVRERGWDRREWDEASCVREVAHCVQHIYQNGELRCGNGTRAGIGELHMKRLACLIWGRHCRREGWLPVHSTQEDTDSCF